MKIKRKLIAEAWVSPSGMLAHYQPGSSTLSAFTRYPAADLYKRVRVKEASSCNHRTGIVQQDGSINCKVCGQQVCPAMKEDATVERKAREFLLTTENVFSETSDCRLMQVLGATGPIKACERVEAREILEGEIVITREQFAKAWDENMSVHSYFGDARLSTCFDLFARSLGFKDSP